MKEILRKVVNFVDVELRLRPKGNAIYLAELAYDGLLNGASLGIRKAACEIELVRETLLQLDHDREAYDQYLASQLFADQRVRELFITAYARAGNNGAFRLWLDLPDDDVLEQIVWERLLHPVYLQPLCIEHRVLISRYRAIIARDEAALPPRPTLGVLGVIADPEDLEQYGCVRINAEAEKNHFCASLTYADALITPTILSSGGQTAPTWENLKRQLQSRSYQILYIACHGVKAEGQTYLLLEDEEGKTDHVPSSEIASFIGQLPPECRPDLVFLASCYSAGDGHGRAPLFFGPQLARAGVPAVVGFQHTVSSEAVSKAIPVFFQQLLSHGQVGRALAETRAILMPHRARLVLSEWWKPALFLGQRNDRLWRELPGFEELRLALSDHFAASLRRPRVQPGEQELTLLALNIARCPGFQERSGELLTVLRLSADGFSKLIEALYGHDAGSAPFAQLEQVLSQVPGLERSIPWSATFKLLVLLKQIAQEGVDIDEKVRSFYYRNIQDGELKTSESGIAMQWRVIDELGGHPGEPPPLVSLVQRLAGLPELTRMQPQLRTWLREMAETLGQQPDAYDRIVQPDTIVAGGNQRLLLILRPTGVQPDEEGWTAQVYFTPDDSRSELWDRKFEAVSGRSLDELAPSLKYVIDRLGPLIDDNREPQVEIALPDGWLLRPVDTLPITLRDEPEPLGSLYPCIVRSASRLLTTLSHRTRRDWKLRWEQWWTTPEPTPQDYLWVDRPEHCEMQYLERLLRASRVGCIVGSVVLSQEQHEPLARKLIAHGMPVMLWYRGPHQEEVPLAAILEQVLGAGRNLPSRIFKLRCPTEEETPVHALEGNLTLLWDNPESLPKTFNPELSALA